MTKPMTWDLEAGRELDALVAEHVFGWKRHRVGKDYDGAHDSEVLRDPSRDWTGFEYPPKGSVHLAYHVPHYSTDAASAMDVLEELARRGWKWDVQNRYGSCRACHINFPAPDYRHVYEKAEKSNAFATCICLAALVAVGAAESRDSRTQSAGRREPNDG